MNQREGRKGKREEYLGKRMKEGKRNKNTIDLLVLHRRSGHSSSSESWNASKSCGGALAGASWGRSRVFVSLWVRRGSWACGHVHVDVVVCYFNNLRIKSTSEAPSRLAL